ncbi:radical SAM protein [Clostridium sardiniense]|uniref:Radical SAM protein n=1 Tax=Clostridium sardiniense TaxID=29369 RepID=A0ABS7L2N8_CLOSR|nr:radical SAM protein [Clostridium sardiniense]MBM7833808.1 MoaA/NifB/PqqE/SkfB family radical SAM enzyme [Clostridium sardiniense]MBY0757290.1 radical SAM protein [Clostridium sardiniense]MDQ0461614.1 MoaA/NifB/PqqE/SkfB family radical SAM enzyme [Clostridium sardiniense]
MGIKDTIKKGTKEAIIKAGIQVLENNPEKNVDKIFNIIRKGIRDDETRNSINEVQRYYEEIPSVHDYIQDILKNTNKNCLSKFFANFVGNATWYGIPKREQQGEKYDTKIPYTILISPSMRCNLRCTGCYAANYSKKDDIPFEEVDRLIKEARDLGIYYIVILGGEPFFNEYMLDIYKKYNDVFFTPFTNGTLFDEELAEKLAELGNVMPMFSLEGFKEETEARRGEGVFDAVMKGMDLLREKGIPFGVSSATAKNNVDVVTSDKYIDMLIEKGARMIWYFMFMPIGDEPVKDMDLMLTPEQRLKLGKRTREIRMTKKIFPIDFFNDAPYVGGCIAGKYYCHINSKEDVEPCIFSHFSTDNVKGRPLVEAFQSPYFKELRKRQPYNKNLLMPCPMIDNPNQIREIVKVTGARPTHPSADLMVKDPEFMEKLDKLAEDFEGYAEKEFQEEFDGTGNYEFSKG